MHEPEIRSSGASTVNISQKGLGNRVILLRSGDNHRKQLTQLVRSIGSRNERIRFLEQYLEVDLTSRSAEQSNGDRPIQGIWNFRQFFVHIINRMR